MKTIFTAGVVLMLLGGSAMAASERGGCGYGGEASVPKAAQSAATTSPDPGRLSVESEGLLTAQSSDTRTIRGDDNVGSGGTRTGGSGAPVPDPTGK